LHKYDEMQLNNTVSNTSQDDIVTHQRSVLGPHQHLVTWLHWILYSSLYLQIRTPFSVLKVLSITTCVFQKQP